MFRKKTATAPSLSDRLAQADAKKASALQTFEFLALDLEDARDEHAGLALEARTEIERLSAIEAEAIANADQSHRTAENVRALVG